MAVPEVVRIFAPGGYVPGGTSGLENRRRSGRVAGLDTSTLLHWPVSSIGPNAPHLWRRVSSAKPHFNAERRWLAMTDDATQPIVIWDVDHVLNPVTPPPACSGFTAHLFDGPGPGGQHATGYVYLNPVHGQWIAELTAAGATHAWASSWGHLAATWIAPRLHPPAANWPVLDVGQVHSTTFGWTSKSQQVLPFVGAARPAFWLDDLFGGKEYGWAEDRSKSGVPTVIRQVAGHLTRADIDAALEWLAVVSQGKALNG